MANGELICGDILVYTYGVLRAKIQDRAGSEPTHLIANPAKWKDLGLQIHRWPDSMGQESSPEHPGCPWLGSYLWGGFTEVTDCFHTSQLPVPILTHKQ